MDDNSSDAVRGQLSAFLINKKYEPYLGVLPDLLSGTFVSFFGNRQLSRKCINRCFIVSFIALLLSCLFSILYNFHDVIKMVVGYGPFLQAMHQHLVKNPKTQEAAVIVATLQRGQFLVWTLPILWAGWCLLPNYASILKTRVILLVIQNTTMNVLPLLTTVAIDFFVSTLLFLANFILFQLVVILCFASYLSIPIDISNFNSDFIVFGVVYSLEATVLLASGLVFFNIPIGNLFWASMLPSLWLWAYITSALIARWLLASRGTLSSIIWLLDFKNHPIRSLGTIMAGLTFVLTLLMQSGLWLLKTRLI